MWEPWTFCCLAGVLVAVTLSLGMGVFNPVSLFSCIWIAVLVLATVGTPSSTLLEATWSLSLVALISIAIGAIAGHLISLMHSAKQQSSISEATLIRWHWRLTLVLLCFGLYQVYLMIPTIQAVGGLGAILTSSGGTLRDTLIQQRAATVQEAATSGSIGQSVINYLLFSGNLSLFTSGLLIARGRTFLAAPPLMISATYSLVSLQRTSFTLALLLVVMTWLLSRHSLGTQGASVRSRARRGLAAGLTVALTLLVLLVPLQLRNQSTQNATGLTSLAEYAVSGVLGLNARNVTYPRWDIPPLIGGTGVASDPGYGAYTFSGLTAILSRLGVTVPQAPQTYDYLSVTYGGLGYLVNTGTSIVDFYFDFGITGVIAGFALLGFTASASARVWRGKYALTVLPLAATALSQIVWSFYGSSFLDDFRYVLLAAGGGALLQRLLTSRARPQRSSEPLAARG